MSLFYKHTKVVVLGVLILSNILVWRAVWSLAPDDKLKVYFFDVGQGDAILIESPDHRRILVDGGPNRKVVSELGKVMPFGDKRIDAVLESHPDKDHVGGLPEVVNRFKVGLFVESGAESENSIDDELKKRLEQKKIPRMFARSGMVINLGDGVKLAILFPDQNVSRWETNDASIVAKVIYKGKSFLLTGDSPLRIENILVRKNKNILKSDVLKAGHHGSRTSTSLLYAQAVKPEYTIISAGKDNRYGHPHRETLEALSNVRSTVLSTSDLGTIKFETDGETLEWNN